jgi:hypothetical protein
MAHDTVMQCFKGSLAGCIPCLSPTRYVYGALSVYGISASGMAGSVCKLSVRQARILSSDSCSHVCLCAADLHAAEQAAEQGVLPLT